LARKLLADSPLLVGTGGIINANLPAELQAAEHNMRTINATIKRMRTEQRSEGAASASSEASTFTNPSGFYGATSDAKVRKTGDIPLARKCPTCNAAELIGSDELRHGFRRSEESPGRIRIVEAPQWREPLPLLSSAAAAAPSLATAVPACVVEHCVACLANRSAQSLRRRLAQGSKAPTRRRRLRTPVDAWLEPRFDCYAQRKLRYDWDENKCRSERERYAGELGVDLKYITVAFTKLNATARQKVRYALT